MPTHFPTALTRSNRSPRSPGPAIGPWPCVCRGGCDGRVVASDIEFRGYRLAQVSAGRLCESWPSLPEHVMLAIPALVGTSTAVEGARLQYAPRDPAGS